MVFNYNVIFFQKLCRYMVFNYNVISFKNYVGTWYSNFCWLVGHNR